MLKAGRVGHRLSRRDGRRDAGAARTHHPASAPAVAVTVITILAVVAVGYRAVVVIVVVDRSGTAEHLVLDEADDVCEGERFRTSSARQSVLA